MKLTDITALGRTPIDPSYPTNRAIAVLATFAVIAGAILRFLKGTAALESVLWGIGAGLAVWLTWALGRELDPDHDLSAFVGAGLVLIALLLVGAPPLLLILWLLVVMRLVNRTTGLPAKPLDSLGALGLGAWLTWQGYWVAGLVTSVALLLDGLLPPPLRRQLFASCLALLATVILSIFSEGVAMDSGPTMLAVVFSIVVAGLFLPVIVTTREVEAVGDATGEVLNPRRVRAAQMLALLTALLFTWWAGVSGILTLLPLWAAMIGVGLYRIANLFMQQRR